MASVRVSV
jgi:hypothetical protein